MVEVSPEIRELCERLRWRYGILRSVTPEFYVKALKEAYEFQGLYVNFWNWAGLRYFHVARNDRLPTSEEFLPFLQELFEDGQIKTVGATKFSIDFAQGKPLFNEDNVSDSMAGAIMEMADRRDEVEQFDLDETSTGKRLIKHLRNGSS